MSRHAAVVTRWGNDDLLDSAIHDELRDIRSLGGTIVDIKLSTALAIDPESGNKSLAMTALIIFDVAEGKADQNGTT